MIEIGKFSNLDIVKEVDFGVYLSDEYGEEEILLPSKYVSENSKTGDTLKVFIYRDSEDRLIATTEVPLAQADEFAYLKVVSVTRIGAFLDWGLPKDLLVPFREQKQKMINGKSYLVYIYVDEQTDRIVASSKIDRWLDNRPATYKNGQEVDLLIANKTSLGYNAIIEQSHWGIIFNNDLFQRIKTGQQIKGFIKKVRPDNKIDLALQKPGYEKVDDLSKMILKKLLENDGALSVTDKSAPEAISEMFGVSKKTYKKALGALYKRKAISIETNAIRLIKNS